MVVSGSVTSPQYKRIYRINSIVVDQNTLAFGLIQSGLESIRHDSSTAITLLTDTASQGGWGYLDSINYPWIRERHLSSISLVDANLFAAFLENKFFWLPSQTTRVLSINLH